MSLRRPSDGGFTLTEAIISCFVLTFAMLVSAALYHTALRHSVRIDRKQRAARVAEQKAEEIRSWSRANHGTNGELDFNQGWDLFDNTTVTDPENPGYTIETTTKPKALFSPSSEFEQINFTVLEDDNIPNTSTLQRRIEESSYMATITVSWGPGPAEKLVTRTLISDPVRKHGWAPGDSDKAIKLEYRTGTVWKDNAPSILAPNQPMTIRARIEDKRGERVRNPVVTWYVDPDCSGNGTIESFPDRPDVARFTNEVKVERAPNAPITVLTGGQAVIVARVRLGGTEAVQKTDPITLGE